MKIKGLEAIFLIYEKILNSSKWKQTTNIQFMNFIYSIEGKVCRNNLRNLQKDVGELQGDNFIFSSPSKYVISLDLHVA